MAQDKPVFQIPKGYEDFVSSSQDLLSQFTGENGEADNDQVCYHLYLDDLISNNNKHDLFTQYQALQKLKETIEELIRQDVMNHIWHRGESFHLEIVCPVMHSTSAEQRVNENGNVKSDRKYRRQQKRQQLKDKKTSVITPSPDDETLCTMMYLKGATKFGENIEDEWYIVYLLMKITRVLLNVSVRVFDNDGDFIMIETADHIPDWLGPENALNRVWIKHGQIHIIPLEAPGQMKLGTSSAMKVIPALQYLCDDPQACRVHGNVHRILASRTTKVFPAKIKALEHNIVCILPEWIAKSLERDPSLVAHAVHAFSSVESKDLSSMLSNISQPPSSSVPSSASDAVSRNKLVAVKVKMTRTLYAQLTFKQFKIPRKYHAMMRRMAVFNSAKVSNAFNIGCRLACGLELAYSESINDKAESIEWKESNARLLQHSLSMNHFLDDQTAAELVRSVLADPVKANTLYHFENGDDEDGYVIDDDDDDDGDISGAGKTRREELMSLLSYRARSSVSDVVHLAQCANSESDTALDSDDLIAAQVIMNDTMLSDNDSWMYMTPEQLDAEMQARIDQFSDLASPITDKADEVPATVDNSNQNTVTVTVTDKEVDSIHDDDNENELQRLQKIVDEFKSFLNEQSDFDGIGHASSNNKKKGTNKTKSTTTVSQDDETSTLNLSTVSDLSPFDGSQFDVKYLEETLKSINLNLDGSLVCEDNSSDTIGSCRESLTEPWIVGVAEKIINVNIGGSKQLGKSEVESLDSDDEIEEFSNKNLKEVNDDHDSDESESEDKDEDEDEDDQTPWNLDDLKHEMENIGMRYRDASSDEVGQSYEQEEEDDDDDDDDEDYGTNFSMADIQRVMDEQLFDEKALANTFAHLFNNRGSNSQDDLPHSAADFDDMDLDANFLMSMMEAHAEGLGAPSGAINQILGQLGLSLPRPPPVNGSDTRKSKK